MTHPVVAFLHRTHSTCIFGVGPFSRALYKKVIFTYLCSGARACGTSGATAPTVDFRGNKLRPRNTYIILKSPPDGPEPGIYTGSWEELCAIVPGGSLPAEGYNYRKPPNLAAALVRGEGGGRRGVGVTTRGAVRSSRLRYVVLRCCSR